MEPIQRYLEQYGLISLEKQEKLHRLVGEHNREIDLDAGIIRFDKIEFPFQVVGTESDNTLTWLWAWSDEQEELPDPVLNASRELKEWGAGAGITEFTVPSVDLDKADGHMISIIASAVVHASSYYHDPYEGGALFLLLFGKEIDIQPSFDVKGLSTQFSFLMSLGAINPRNALLSYLRTKNLTFVEKETTITGELESGETLNVEFDREGMVKSINGSEIAA